MMLGRRRQYSPLRLFVWLLLIALLISVSYAVVVVDENQKKALRLLRGEHGSSQVLHEKLLKSRGDLLKSLPIYDFVIGVRQEGGDDESESNDESGLAANPPLPPPGPGETMAQVCMNVSSPQIGYPQEFSDDIKDLIAENVPVPNNEWLLLGVEGDDVAKDYYTACYGVYVDSVQRDPVRIEGENYVQDNSTGLVNDLEERDWNTTGLAFTIPEIGPYVFDEGVIAAVNEGGEEGEEEGESEVAPLGSEERSVRNKRIIASVVGVSFVIGITIIIIQLVPRSGAVGNDRANVLRRRRFLRWVDNAEEENEEDVDDDERAPGSSSGPDIEDLPSDFSQEVVTEATMSSAPRSVSTSAPTTVPRSNTDYNMDMGLREGDIRG